MIVFPTRILRTQQLKHDEKTVVDSVATSDFVVARLSAQNAAADVALLADIFVFCARGEKRREQKKRRYRLHSSKSMCAAPRKKRRVRL